MIKDFVDALDTVQNSNLPATSKRAIQDVILHSTNSVTQGMAHAICDAVTDTSLFLAELSRPDSTPQTLRTAFDTYARTMQDATTQPDGDLRPGIAGGPEASTTRALTAQAACLLAGLGTLNPLTGDELRLCTRLESHHQALPEALAPRYAAMKNAHNVLSQIVSPGSPLHPMRYAIAHQADPGTNTRNELLLLNVLENLSQASGSDDYDRLLSSPAGLGLMRMAQARQFEPQGIGLPQKGQAFNMANARRSMTAGINQTVTETPPGTGSAILRDPAPEFARKLNLFSDAFLKDFCRNGVIVNGHQIGTGIGSDDPAALEAALDELIAQFPSPEEAGRVCSPIHQAIGADMLISLNTDPATAAATTQFMTGGSKLSDNIMPSITRQADGSYAIHVEYSGQQDPNALLSGSAIGLNIAVDFALPNGHPPLEFTTTGFDALFSTVTL